MTNLTVLVSVIARVAGIGLTALGGMTGDSVALMLGATLVIAGAPLHREHPTADAKRIAALERELGLDRERV